MEPSPPPRSDRRASRRGPSRWLAALLALLVLAAGLAITQVFVHARVAKARTDDARRVDRAAEQRAGELSARLAAAADLAVDIAAFEATNTAGEQGFDTFLTLLHLEARPSPGLVSFVRAVHRDDLVDFGREL